MKKSYLILGAAVTILASCAQTEKLNNDLKDNEQPAVIGFSSFSEKATRADNGDDSNINNLEFFHSTFAVYGTKQSVNDPTDISYIFGADAETAAGAKNGSVCTYTNNNDASFYGSNWRYDDPRYWDKQANYQFIAYAPAVTSNPLRYEYAATGKLVGADGNDFVATDYILTGKNLQATPSSAPKNKGFNVNNQDLDLMTSGLKTQAGSNHGQVQLTFKHILAKVNIMIGKSATLDGADVTIDSIAITSLKDKGSYSENLYDVSGQTPVSGWRPNNVNDNNEYALKYIKPQESTLVLPETNNSAAQYLYFVESLVIPQPIGDAPKLAIKYTIKRGEHTESFIYNMDLKDAFTSFFDRSNYTLKFTIGPSVITFDASAAAWADNLEESFDIND